MNKKTLKRNGEKTVKQVMKHWRKYNKISKREFEEGLKIIIKNISKQTETPLNVVAQHTHPLIDEFIHDYKSVPNELKGYEAIISMLYLKYMQKLGFLENKRQVG